MSVEIRRATADDVIELGRLHGQCWDETYRGLVADSEIDRKIASAVASWNKQFAHVPQPVAWLAFVDSELAGFISIAERGDDYPRPLEVCALYILRKYIRRGIGRMLLEKSIGDDPAFLWCVEGNTPAENFYVSQGFTPGRKEPWEAAGVNDVLYVR